MMTLKFLSRLLGIGIAAAAVTTSFAATDANTVAKRRLQAQKIQAQKNSSVNYSYQSGPRTRVYVTKRSWLDAGTEVSPGDRKFNDYATGGPNAFENLDRLNSHMDRRRSPLSTPSDVGGSPFGFPLY